MSCEHENLVHAYHDGELDRAASADALAHIQQCADCARLLRELRGVSGLLARGMRSAMPEGRLTTYYSAWNRSRERSTLRIASWLTAAAAAVLVGALLVRPGAGNVGMARSGMWESAAVTPPVETSAESGSEMVQVAQWFADDLSAGEKR